MMSSLERSRRDVFDEINVRLRGFVAEGDGFVLWARREERRDLEACKELPFREGVS